MLRRTDPVRHLAAVRLVFVYAQNAHSDTQRDRADEHHEQVIDACHRRKRTG